MIYRNDIEALEARYRALEAEVIERIRARDEVARMLADARARAKHESELIDLVVGTARRRRRMWFAAVMAVLVAIGCGIGFGVAKSRGPDRDQRMMARYEAFVDEVCWCADEACAERAMARLTAWFESMARDGSPPQARQNTAIVERARQAGDRFTVCVAKLKHLDDAGAVQR